MEGCLYLFFLKFVVDKSKNEMPNNKYVTASVVFLSIKFTIDTIKKHIEANKKHIHLIFSFLSFSMIFPPRSIRIVCSLFLYSFVTKHTANNEDDYANDKRYHQF